MAAGREDLGEAVLELVTDPTKLRAGMAAARQETTKTLGSANDALRGIGQKMTATGGQMTRGVTVPVIAAGAAIVSVGADFEHTMSQIVGLVGVSREQINAWKPEIEDLARSTGIGPNELAKGLYFVASSGIEASKAMGVLTIAARASQAGMGDVEMLADVLTGTMNAYAKSNLTAAHAMDVLVRGIQVGKAEPAAFADAMGTVAPIAAQLNVSVEDLVGTLAILSRTNSNVAENATSLGQVLNTLLKPSNQTAEALSKMGLTAAGLRQELAEKGLLSVLKTLAERVGEDDEAIAQIFPNIRALRGVLNLTGQDAISVSEAMDKVRNSTGALDGAVLAVADDAQVQLNKALAKMQVELIILSKDVMPGVVSMFNTLVDGIHGAVTWFSSLPAPVKSSATAGLALLAVLGPILVVLGSIISAGTGVVGGFKVIAGFLSSTLIPRFAQFLAMLAAGTIHAFGEAILMTGIPALQRLAVALIGVKVAGGPLLLIASAIVAIGLAASGASPSIDELRSKIAELRSKIAELEQDVGFLDFRQADRIAVLKAELAEMEAAEAAAAAKEKELLLERQKAWAEWSADVQSALGDLVTHLGLGDVPGAVGGMVDEVAAGLKSGKYKIENGALVLADGIPGAFEEKGRAAARAVTRAIGDIARAIRAGRQEIVDAMNDVVADAYDPLILAADIAATKTELAEARKIAATKGYTEAQIEAVRDKAKTDKQREAADALHTKAEVAEAKRRVLLLEKQLGQQLNDQTRFGTDLQRLNRLTGRAASNELIVGLRSGDEQRRTASVKAANDLASGIIALMNKTKSYGIRTGNAYIDGLIAAFEERQASVRRAFSGLTQFFEASSPPGPASPMHLIDKWGFRTGLEYPMSMAKGLAAGAGAIRRQLGGFAALMGGGAGGTELGRIEQMGDLRVVHVLDEKSAAGMAAAGLSSKEVGQALADGVNASGLFDHLRGLQTMSGR